MTNTNDIVSGVYARLGTANMPSEIVSGDIISLANDRINDMAGFTGQTIDSTAIPSNFIAPLKDLTTADVIARMLGIDIDTEIGIGNIRLGYSNLLNAETRQMEYFLQKAENALNMQGRRIVQTKTTKTT